MPKPKKGESAKKFLKRCIPIRREEHPDEEKERSVAACMGIYRDHRRKSKKGKD